MGNQGKRERNSEVGEEVQNDEKYLPLSTFIGELVTAETRSDVSQTSPLCKTFLFCGVFLV